jgi:hypothetical protein
MEKKVNRTVLRANHFDPRVDLENKIVSLVFRSAEGQTVDIWLSPKDSFVVLAGFERLLRDYPQIATWAKPDQSRLN